MLKAFAASSAENIAGETASELAGLIELVITRIPLWIAAVIVIFMSVLIAKIGRNMMENKLAEKGIEEEHKELQILGGRMTYTVILTLGITIGLKIAGIDLTTIIAAVAFGIGFALKDLIMNFLAGIMVLVGRHFTIGDFINIGGTIGRVVEIQSRVTVLQAIDGTKVIVPNADLFKKQVTSFTSNPFRRIEVLVGVDYRNNLENVTRICMKVLKTTKGVLVEPKPAVVINEFGENGVTFKVKAWVDSKGGWLKIKSDLMLRLKKEFDKYGIVIPWPIRTVVYDKDQDMVEKIMEEEQGRREAKSPGTEEEAKKAAATPTPVYQEVEAEEKPLRPLGEVN